MVPSAAPPSLRRRQYADAPPAPMPPAPRTGTHQLQHGHLSVLTSSSFFYVGSIASAHERTGYRVRVRARASCACARSDGIFFFGTGSSSSRTLDLVNRRQFLSCTSRHRSNYGQSSLAWRAQPTRTRSRTRPPRAPTLARAVAWAIAATRSWPRLAPDTSEPTLSASAAPSKAP